MKIGANTPIIDAEGNIVALWARDYEMRPDDHFHWTWFSPSDQAEMVAGPQFQDDAKTQPVNQGTLWVAFHKGQVTVLEHRLQGKTDGAFSGRWFRRPDDPVGESWRGKIAAVKVLREYLSGPMHEHQLDRLEEMFTHYAECEEDAQ